MQTSIPIKPSKYVQGETHTFRRRVLDLMPLEDVPFGFHVNRSNVDSKSCRLPLVNQLDFDFDGNLDADDVFTVTMKLTNLAGQDTALTAVSVTYGVSHAATVTAIIGAIKGLNVNLDAVALPDAAGNANRKIRVTAKGDYKLVETVAAANSGATGVDTTKGTCDVQAGPAERDRNTPAILNYGTSTAPYHKAKFTMLAAVVHGDPAVPVNQTVQAGDPVYVLLEDYTDQESVLNPRGTYRKDDDDGLAPVARVDRSEFSDNDENGLAPVSVTK